MSFLRILVFYCAAGPAVAYFLLISVVVLVVGDVGDAFGFDALAHTYRVMLLPMLLIGAVVAIFRRKVFGGRSRVLGSLAAALAGVLPVALLALVTCSSLKSAEDGLVGPLLVAALILFPVTSSVCALLLMIPESPCVWLLRRLTTPPGYAIAA